MRCLFKQTGRDSTRSGTCYLRTATPCLHLCGEMVRLHLGFRFPLIVPCHATPPPPITDPKHHPSTLATLQSVTYRASSLPTPRYTSTTFSSRSSGTACSPPSSPSLQASSHVGDEDMCERQAYVSSSQCTCRGMRVCVRWRKGIHRVECARQRQWTPSPLVPGPWPLAQVHLCLLTQVALIRKCPCPAAKAFTPTRVAPPGPAPAASPSAWPPPHPQGTVSWLPLPPLPLPLAP